MKSLFNFAVTVKDDLETYDFMYRLVGGIIYSVANSPMLSLNFYPVLGELGTVSERLVKICRWSTNLARIMKSGAAPMVQRLANREEVTNWLRSVKDKRLGANLRLFVHQFVTVPNEVFEQTESHDERFEIDHLYQKRVKTNF